MVVKRKGKSTTTPNKQQKKLQDEQPSKPIEEEKVVEEQKVVEDEPVMEEVEEEVEEEIEEDEEIEPEEEEEEIEPEEDENEDENEDEDEEPISSLIEPFTKEQLVAILREAAEKHADVAASVRSLADKDPVHRKIFVHGLGWDTTTDTLRTLFEQYGEIEDCKAVSDKLTGKSKGYGFVLFKTRTGAKKALLEPQKTVNGRTVACQLSAVGPVSNNAVNNGGSGVVVGYQSEFTQRKIYVSNVSAEIDPGKLKEYFSRFGEIEDGPLGIDKGTGKFKGFCLFVYKSVESARKALEEPQKVYEGHTLNCKRAVDGPKGGKGNVGGGGGGGGSYHSGGRGGGRGGGSGYARGQNPNLGGGLPVSTPGLMPGYSGGGFNPALGQALTALLASQGAGLGGLNSMLGGGMGVPMGGAQIGQGLGGGYGNQSGYPNQQMGGGQGSGVGRSQYGGYTGAPYGGL